MLQDAVWVNADWITEEGNEDVAVRFLKATFRGWIHCLDNFDECVGVVLDNGSTLGESHQAWQLNEILGLIFPASSGIGVMNESLWDQTVEVATGQIEELQGVDITGDAYRTDLAQQAVDELREEGLDVDGESYERRDIELRLGGE
jgi:NitT/TauT family transport system substrate-binding protein